MAVWQIIGAGIIGMALGYVMQRPQVCYNRAYRNATLQGNNTMLRALALAMLVQMVGFYALVELGVVKLNIVPGIWLAALVGGFLFGFSFVFARGCSTTMWYRIGNGNLGALAVLVAFAAGEVLTFGGPLDGLRQALWSAEIHAASGQPATLPNLTGLPAWVFVVPLALAGGWWLWRSARREGTPAKLGGWTWPVTGLLLGGLGTAAWVVSQGTGWDYGVGVVGATGPVLRSLWEGPGVLSWGSFVVLGMPIGGFVAARQRGEFVWQIPDWRDLGVRLASGLAMGITASLAGGCNVGHTFSGAPTLALSSLLASVAIFAGAVAGNRVRFGWLRLPLPAVSPGD